MSNEYNDWLWNRFSDVLLEANKIDKVLQTIVLDWVEWCAVVDGIKDGYHVRYRVWYDDDEELWHCDPEEINT